MSSWKSTRRIWDISQTLRPDLPVWPGDTRFGFERTWRMDEGSPVNVGRMTMSTHSGTHADAPLHYAQGALDAASMEIDPYIGTCLVVDARGVNGAIDIADLPHIDSADRVLFRTWDSFPHDEWRSDWLPIAAERVAVEIDDAIRQHEPVAKFAQRIAGVEETGAFQHHASSLRIARHRPASPPPTLSGRATSS